MEENKLIAEFLGYKHFSNGEFKNSDNGGHWDRLSLMETWDYLIPTVQAIHKLQEVNRTFDLTVNITGMVTLRTYDRRHPAIKMCQMTTKESVYKAVIECIKWINKIKEE